MIHSSRPRPSREDEPLEDKDAASALNDREERALEAIRRQLDIDFPFGDEEPAVARRTPWRERPDARTPPTRRPTRPIHIGAALGVLSLAVCAVAGGAGVRLVVEYVRTVDSRATADRQAVKPSARSAGVARVTPAAPPASPSAPAREIVGPRAAAAPTPERIAPIPPAAPPAPAPEIVLPPRRPASGAPTSASEPRPSSPAPGQGASRPTVFYYSAQYFKYLDGIWLVADQKEGPWTPVTADRVPAALQGLPGAPDSRPAQPNETVTSP